MKWIEIPSEPIALPVIRITDFRISSFITPSKFNCDTVNAIEPD